VNPDATVAHRPPTSVHPGGTPPLLEVQHLRVELQSGGLLRTVVRDVSFSVAPAEAVGLVGESGAGKSITARALLRLLPPNAEMSGGIVFDGRPVTAMDRHKLRAFRAGEVAIIFQDPRVHINPVRTIGDFLTEGLRSRGVSLKQARIQVVDLLEQVRISNPRYRLKQYPHELSGGMLQRIMIAAALAAGPRLLLADEPTTALDVTTQAEVMAILADLRRERNLAMLFITHDLELAAASCDRTLVMYAGVVIEDQPSQRLHDDPRHPYTAGLVRSRPDPAHTYRRLPAMPGRPLAAHDAPDGCAFAARCGSTQGVCRAETPRLRRVGWGLVACHRAEELRGRMQDAAETGGEP
jgi:oligopeptide/dipeptide ABC transporter ATP-binding protein